MILRSIEGVIESCRQSGRDFFGMSVYYVNLEERGRFFYLSRKGQKVSSGEHVEADIFELIKRTSKGRNSYPWALSVRVIEGEGIKGNLALEY